MATTYDVVLLDKDGLEISTYEFEVTLKAAKERAKYLLSDKYANYCEATHADWNTHKVEVRKNGGCVWDKFYEAQ